MFGSESFLDDRLAFWKDKTLTATGNSGIVNLQKVFGDSFAINQGKKRWTVLLDIASTDSTNKDETYKFKLQTSKSSTIAKSVDLFEITVTRGENGVFELPIPITQEVHQYWRIVATLGGTTPSVKIIRAQFVLHDNAFKYVMPKARSYGVG